jgi:type II secretory pathway pseudopilin PulG
MRKLTLNREKQRGATLIVALIVLIVVMILGVGAVMTANTQLKMAGNLQFQNEAKNRAENRLVDAESWISAPANGGATVNLGNFPLTSAIGKDNYQIRLLAQNKSPAGGSAGVGGPPVSGCNQVNLFELVGHGEGARGATRDIVAVYGVLSC